MRDYAASGSIYIQFYSLGPDPVLDGEMKNKSAKKMFFFYENFYMVGTSIEKLLS